MTWVFSLCLRKRNNPKGICQKNHFQCPVYCYSIAFLPLNDDMEFQRLGKRRLKKIAENIEQEQQWFRKWVRLQANN